MVSCDSLPSNTAALISLAGRGALGIDGWRGASRCIRVEQGGDRDFDEIGIAQVLGAVGEVAAHGLGHVVDVEAEPAPAFS